MGIRLDMPISEMETNTKSICGNNPRKQLENVSEKLLLMKLRVPNIYSCRLEIVIKICVESSINLVFRH